jgi:hypothetical protein
MKYPLEKTRKKNEAIIFTLAVRIQLSGGQLTIFHRIQLIVNAHLIDVPFHQSLHKYRFNY